jgi:hypothetical protein
MMKIRNMHEIIPRVLLAGLALYTLHLIFRLCGAEHHVLGLVAWAAGLIGGHTFSAAGPCEFTSADGMFVIRDVCSGWRLFMLLFMAGYAARLWKESARALGETGFSGGRAAAAFLTGPRQPHKPSRPDRRQDPPAFTSIVPSLIPRIAALSFCANVLRIAILIKFHVLFAAGGRVPLRHTLVTLCLTLGLLPLVLHISVKERKPNYAVA